MPRSPRRFRNRRRTAVRTTAAALLAAALLAATLLASASAAVSRASAQEAIGCFEPQPLPGLTLAAFAGGGPGALERCAAGFGVRVHTPSGGAWLTLDPASDDEANAAFRARYEGGAAAGTLFLLERRTPVGLVVREEGASEGYTLFATHRHTVVYLIDGEGRQVHAWNRPAFDQVLNPRLLENGNLLVKGNLQDDTGQVITEIDRDSGTVWEYRYDGDGDHHHDFLKLPNGNLLLLVWRTKTYEEAVAAGADPALTDPGGVVYESIAEIRLDGTAGRVGGEIVWEWSMWDHLIQDFDADRDNYGDVAAHPERIDLNYMLKNLRNGSAHANSIDYHLGLDQIVISARNFSELWIVDHGTTTEEAAGSAGGKGGRGGDLLYRWGNPRAHRAGTADGQQLFWPHDIHWIAPGLPGAGNILVFNNGAEFGEYGRGWSSVVEIAPPAEGYGYRPGEPAEVTWTYEADPPSAFVSLRLSGAQRLPNGNTLICYGTEGTIFEVTPEGETIWRYVNPIVHGRGEPLRQGDLVPLRSPGPIVRWENLLFRAVRYPPDYPGLRGLDLTPKGTLELYREP